MDINDIKQQIIDDFVVRSPFELTSFQREAIELWLEKQLIKLGKDTAAIPKEEVRFKSLGMMIGKKFDKMLKLLNILDQHQLLQNPVLFSQLLDLLV